MTPQEQAHLEGLIDRAVRGLPARKAPAALEARVHAEIARRAARPWWRKSFAHWPSVAKLVFAVASLGVIQGLFVAVSWIGQGLSLGNVKAVFGPEIQMFGACGRLIATAFDIAGTLLGSIPTLWVYGGIAIVVSLYVALFGLGAAAYRTLYASN